MPETDKALVSVEMGVGLLPQNFEGLYRIAQIMAASNLMPKDFKTPESIFVAIAFGMELGLGLMASVQNIAVINGRPSVFGDAVLGMVRASGWLEDFNETFEGNGESLTAICTARRKGQTNAITQKFSIDDAKKAKLYPADAASPWTKYTRRMLQMRARTWTLRDGFGDILKGISVAEEMMDVERSNERADGVTEIIIEKPDEDTQTFSELLPADVDKEMLDKFLENCAQNFKTSREEIEADAALDFDAFWAQFLRWIDKQPQESEHGTPSETSQAKQSDLTRYYNKMKELKEACGEERYYATLLEHEMKSAAGAKNMANRKKIVNALKDRLNVDLEDAQSSTEDIPLPPLPEENNQEIKIACPENNGDMINTIYCNEPDGKGCKKREGCPAWETEDNKG